MELNPELGDLQLLDLTSLDILILVFTVYEQPLEQPHVPIIVDMEMMMEMLTTTMRIIMMIPVMMRLLRAHRCPATVNSEARLRDFGSPWISGSGEEALWRR